MFTEMISLFSTLSHSLLSRSESPLVLIVVLMCVIWNNKGDTAPGSDPSWPLHKTVFAEPLVVCQTVCANSSV